MTLSILLQVNENWRLQTIISQYLAYEFRTRKATRQLVIFQMLYDLSNNMEKNFFDTSLIVLCDAGKET